MNCSEVEPALLSYVQYRFKETTQKLFRIEWLVFLTFVITAALFPIQYLRRRKYRPLLKALGSMIYPAITLLIPYIYGLMLSLEALHVLIPIWAVFLLFVYASVPFSLKDRSSPGITVMKFLVYSIYLMLLIFKLNDLSSTPLIVAILPLELKVFDRILHSISWAVRNDHPSKKRLSKISECIGDDNIPEVRSDFDDPLLKCKYVVDHNRVEVKGNEIVNLGEIITIHKIWSSATTEPQLKSTCLSFSLYRLLLHKFVGLPSYESSYLYEAWSLIRNGLLDQTRSINEHLCPFKVIQEELEFLHDYFFSPSKKVYFTWQYLSQLILQLGFFVVLSWVIALSFAKYDQMPWEYIIFTGILMLFTVVLELAQLIASVTSKQTKINMLCTYLRRTESRKENNTWDYCIKKAAQIWFQVWRPCHGKHRQIELGQYSLLHSCSYLQQRTKSTWECFRTFVPSKLSCFNSLIGNIFPRPGRKQSNRITLSKPISDALVRSLRDQGPQLTGGIASLMEACGDLSQDVKVNLLVDALTSKGPNTDARVVLVCHIATSTCEISTRAHHLDLSQCSDFQVATSLSKYCAYLVAFAPDLLHGEASITDHICNKATEDAFELLKDCDSSQMYGKLMEKAEADSPYQSTDSSKYMDDVLHQGASLGRILDTKIEDASKRWKVLADLWAEMILYLAPNSSNHWDHVEKLQDGGGEFITLLWALLFHAGIEDRNSFSINLDNNTSATNNSA